MEYSLFKNFYSKKEIEDIEKKINLLGSDVNYNSITILNLRSFTSVIVFFVLLYIYSKG